MKPELHPDLPSDAELRRRLQYSRTNDGWPSLLQIAYFTKLEIADLKKFLKATKPLARHWKRVLWELLRKFESGAWKVDAEGAVKLARNPRPALTLAVDFSGKRPKLVNTPPLTTLGGLPQLKEVQTWLTEMGGVAKLARNQAKSSKNTVA